MLPSLKILPGRVRFVWKRADLVRQIFPASKGPYRQAALGRTSACPKRKGLHIRATPIRREVAVLLGMRLSRLLKASCLLSSLWFLTHCTFLGADVGESQTEGDGWKGVSAREELRPEFERLATGGPLGRGSLIIRADEREGLDGHLP